MNIIPLDKKELVQNNKMLRNWPIEGLEDSILPNTDGHACGFIGRASSGKTNLVVSLLNGPYKKKFNSIYFYSPTSHTIGKKLKIPDEHLKKNLSTLEQDFNEVTDKYKEGLDEGEIHNALFVFDDLISEMKKGNKLLRQIILNRGHSNLSVWIISQKYNLIPQELRINLSHLCIFGTKNMKEMESITDETSLFYNKKNFEKALRYCWSTPYSFAYMNIHKGDLYNRFEERIEEVSDGNNQQEECECEDTNCKK